MVPRPRAVPRPRRLLTDDGVVVEAVHRPAVGSDAHGEMVLVVAHGFTGSWRRPAVRRIAEALRAHGGVVCFDFRGHGGSGGASTLGDREVLDLDAVLRWVRALGYARVVTVGFSMGGAVVVRHAGLRAGVDAVVSVSSPSRWYYRGTRVMRLAHRGFETREGRVVLRHLYRTRVDATSWDPARPESWPVAPREAASGIPPTPYLVVHGDRDAFFPPDHAYDLAEAGSGELWLEPGLGHAENAAPPELVDRIGRWAASAVAVA